MIVTTKYEYTMTSNSRERMEREKWVFKHPKSRVNTCGSCKGEYGSAGANQTFRQCCPWRTPKTQRGVRNELPARLLSLNAPQHITGSPGRSRDFGRLRHFAQYAGSHIARRVHRIEQAIAIELDMGHDV